MTSTLCRLALRDMAGGRRSGAESTPLIGGAKRQASFLSAASFSLLIAAVVVLVLNNYGAVELQQKISKQQMLAKALMQKGLDLENAGQKDVEMAKLLLSMHSPHGIMLAGNDTNATEPEEGSEPPTLEDRGVNVNSWPHEHEVKFLPHQKKKNTTVEYVQREVTHNHDWYHYDPLRTAGVNTGKWFWEDEDEMGPPDEDDAAPPAAGNATDGNSTEAEGDEEEEEETAEERLRKAGVKIGGWPWDPIEEEEPEEAEEEKEEEAEGEEEGEGGEEEAEPAAKAVRLPNLYQKGRAAYKQYQREMAHRLLKTQRVH